MVSKKETGAMGVPFNAPSVYIRKYKDPITPHYIALLATNLGSDMCLTTKRDCLTKWIWSSQDKAR